MTASTVTGCMSPSGVKRTFSEGAATGAALANGTKHSGLENAIQVNRFAKKSKRKGRVFI